jgi:cytochrome c-type biogenesis protein CcmH/NrfF
MPSPSPPEPVIPAKPESPYLSFQPPSSPESRSPSPRGPVFWARAIQIALLCVVSIAMIGATRSQYDRIGHAITCSCPCGEILIECNHVHCSYQPAMLQELRAQIATGAGDKSILDWFVAKYGPIILASPIRSGFDRVAWIVPLAVFLLATLGTFAIVWFWKRRTQQLAAPIPTAAALTPQDPALRERIRRETEY